MHGRSQFLGGVSDNCGATYSQTGGFASSDDYPIGDTENTFEASDVAGNTVTCSFTVTVLLSADPTLVHAYTAFGFNEVKMKKNTVQSGGVALSTPAKVNRFGRSS